jgi:phosphoglycerate dehydrogenase-like enzyme
MNLLITFPLPAPVLQHVKRLPHFKTVHYYPSTFVPNSTHPHHFWNHEPSPIPDAVWAATDVLQTMFICPATRAQAPNLKFIQGMSAGLEHLLSAPFFSQVLQEADATTTSKTGAEPLIMCSASGIHSTKIAEYILMQTLSMYTRLPFLLEHAKDQRWNRTAYVPPGALSGAAELRGKTMGIIGYGCIGRETARLARAFGMEIVVATSSGKQAPGPGFVIEGTGDEEGLLPRAWYSTSDPEALKKFMEEVDVLMLSCPLTQVTRHIVSAESIRYLKSTAIVINIARGGLIDHEALIKALEEERIGAACLDVTDPEPLPDKHPLWTAKNCFVTPHIAGATEYYARRCVELLDVNMQRWKAGQKVLNPVSLSKGY